MQCVNRCSRRLDEQLIQLREICELLPEFSFYNKLFLIFQHKERLCFGEYLGLFLLIHFHLWNYSIKLCEHSKTLSTGYYYVLQRVEPIHFPTPSSARLTKFLCIFVSAKYSR